VDIKDLLLSLQSEYTILKIESPERLILKIDRRATKSILENLIENSRHHGGATQVIITAIKKNDYAKIVVYDNGKGFQGNPKNLGKPFFRHSTTSGSGIGLYLIKSLIEKMKGEFHLNNLKNGFEIEIHLPIAEPG
jgi:signal transduction histidine kinase